MRMNLYNKIGLMLFVLLFPIGIFGLILFSFAGRGKMTSNYEMLPLVPTEGDIHIVTFQDIDGNVIANFSVNNGESVPKIPVYDPDEYVFARWDYPAYAGLTITEIPVYEDMVIEPILYDQTLIVMNALGMSGLDAEEVDVDALEALIKTVERVTCDEDYP